ncbi:MAG: class I SAM-dependent methyltransferase, partial [Nanoarchaeota archaeon]|nr:class I SAM-dependent methyltransferase [Nanoarchaeota archaeon]
YERIGKDYLLGQKEFFSKREDQAIKFIKNSLIDLKGKKVLDIGCGNGKDIKLIESLGASEVYGIDSSNFMLNEAKKIVSNPENLYLSNIEKTSFEDNFFDIIIGRFSFHYLSNYDNAYNELSRILKKNALLILVIHHPFKDLISQKNKIYGEQEIIKIELYNNKVPIYFPTHTLKDYFSRSFFDSFMLVGFEEEQSPEEYGDKFKIPGFMGIKAIKK